MAFAERFRKRRGLDAITGYNGGSLQDQLDEDPQQPTGQMLSAANTAAITRPRVVSPFVNRLMNQPAPAQPNEFAGPSVPQPAQPQGSVATNQPMPDDVSAATRPRMANPNPFLDRLMNNPAMQERTRQLNPPDAITSDSDYLRQIQSKPDTLRDKLGLVAQSISRNLGGQPLPTRKQHEEEQATGALQRDLAVERQQVLNQQGMMVPVYDNQGNVIGNAPARTAVGSQIRQNLGQQQADERKSMNAAHKARWDQMGRNERARSIMDEYKSGGMNGNPEMLEQASRELGLTGTLKDKFIAGQFRGDVDANGNLIRENLQTGEATPITQTTTTPQGQTTTAPVQSFKVTQQNRQDERARLGREAAMNRTLVMAKATGARLGDPQEFENLASEADQNAKTAEDESKSDTLTTKEATARRAEAERHRQLAFKLREAAIKARGGQSVGTTPTQNAPSAGGGSFNLGAWKADHPNATEAQISAQRAKAQARRLAIVE